MPACDGKQTVAPWLANIREAGVAFLSPEEKTPAWISESFCRD